MIGEHRVKCGSNPANMAMGLGTVRTYPQYSTKHFFLMLGTTLARYDMDLIRNFQPGRMAKSTEASPNDKVYYTKLGIADFNQCDENLIVILQCD